MKGINKILIIFYLLSLLSCKTASLITFESEKHADFNNNKITKVDDDPFFYNRILTAVCVDIVFFKYSKTKDFNDICVKKFKIYDDNENLIYFKENVVLSSFNSTIDEINNFYSKIYYHEFAEEEISRSKFENYKTKYVILKYEIDGKEYSDKLIRKEEKHFVLPT